MERLPVDDGKLDLSMSQLDEVPMKEIIVVKNKVRKLDLSNNQLQILPAGFATNLTLLVELDLSKNQLAMIPDNFGILTNLQHLDLYSNKIERLPLSFKELKKLRWLDLKDNPLTPQLAKIAGPCVDKEDCKKCARDIVLVMQEIHKNIEEGKQSSPKSKPEDATSGTTKDKKKKKKANKGTDASKAIKESPKQNQAAALKELEPEDKEEINTMNTGMSSGLSNSKGPGLCYSLLRAFIWTLLLVCVFIGGLFVTSHPEVKPFASNLNQKLQIAKIEFLRYSDVYLETLAVRLSGLKEIWAATVTQIHEFVNGPLIIYMEDFKGSVVQGFSNLRLQVNEYLAKKD